jgi:hypothetical protein
MPGHVGDEVLNALAVHWSILIQDLRYTARTLNRARGFAFTAILVSALGVGANTAAFSVDDFVLLRPLPFDEPETLVRLCEGPRTGRGWGCMNQLSPANYRDFKTMSASFRDIGAFADDAVNLVDGGEPRRRAIAPVTAEGASAAGRETGAGPRVRVQRGGCQRSVISYGLWQSQFAGDAGVLGRTVRLNGAPYTIIGVMPRGFHFPNRDIQAWTALTFRPEDFADRTNSYIQAVGRLRPRAGGTLSARRGQGAAGAAADHRGRHPDAAR